MFDNIYNAMAKLENELKDFKGEKGDAARKHAGILAGELNKVSQFRSDFYKHYKVIGEWIHSSTYFELEEHSGQMTQNDIMNCEDFQSPYYAIVAVEDSGTTYIVEDDFKTAEDAWKRYDEMELEYVKERYFEPVEKPVEN